MSIYNALNMIKKLVDDCENLIRDGKLAISLEDVNLALRFVESTRTMFIHIKTTLENTRQALDEYKQNDALSKHVSVYYRMAILVSVPYIAMILKNVANVLEKKGYPDKAEEAKYMADNFELVVNTLRSRKEHR